MQATLWIWVALLAVMAMVPSQTAFWIVGFAIGLNYGGVNAAERPMMLTLIPAVQAGRYFSLMLLSARVAAVVGPVVWVVTLQLLEPRFGAGLAYRAAVLTVAAMFFISLLILRGVPDRHETKPGVTS